MKRLLCIVGGMNTGGAETFLMKLYRQLDSSKYQMDFCVSNKKKGFYDDEIIDKGGRIIHTVAKSKNPFASFITINKIVKEGNYKYVMRISQHSLSALDLLSAKLAGSKVLVFRSSNSRTMKPGLEAMLHKLFMFLPKSIPNVKIAPSIPAAKFMFGEKSINNGEVLFLRNAIPIQNFLFDKARRDNMRHKLKVDNEFLIGHIGRFSDQKNHEYLIKIYADFRKIIPNSKLILIGSGENEDKVREQVRNLSLDDSVKFLGVRTDIPDLLMAMDAFVFPSFYEGMPNTVIEAQATGLKCLISNTVTKEANITGNVIFIPLEEKTIKWVSCLKNIYDENYKRDNESENFIKNGYNIKDCAKQFVKEVFEKQ